MKVTICAENSAGERFTAEVEMLSKEENRDLNSFRNPKFDGTPDEVVDQINKHRFTNSVKRKDRAKMRARLNDIAEQNVTLGGKLIRVGRQLLDNVFWIMEKCPNDNVGRIFEAVIGGVISVVPVISFVIGSILEVLEPILEYLTKAVGRLSESAMDLIQKAINRFNPLRTNPA